MDFLAITSENGQCFVDNKPVLVLDNVAEFQNNRTLAELEKENKLKDQKNYAAGHSPGSATTAAGKSAVDPFVEGLFADY